MIPAIRRHVNNFFREALPQRGRPLSTTTYAVAVASLAVIGYAYPSLAVVGTAAAAYAGGAFIWDRTLGRPRVAHVPVVDANIPAGEEPLVPAQGALGDFDLADIDTAVRRSLRHLEYEYKKGASAVLNEILQDGTTVALPSQIQIGNLIYDGKTFVQAMLGHKTMRNALHNGPLSDTDVETLCLFLGIPVDAFRNVWTQANKDAAAHQAQLTALAHYALDNTLAYKDLLNRMGATRDDAEYGRLSEQMVAMRVSATEDIERTVLDYGQTRRTELLKALLDQYNSEVVLD